MKNPLIKFGWLRATLFLPGIFLFAFLANVTMKFFIRFLGNASLEYFTKNTFGKLWYGVILNLLTAVIAVIFFRKLIDKQNVKSLGFSVNNFKTQAGTGFCVALLIIILGTDILFGFDYLRFTQIHFDASALFSVAVMMVGVALAEELIFRGYLLNNLMQSMNRWIALLVSAVLFAIAHGGNPNASFLSLLEIFVGGILLGINYIFTKNLWFSIALHFAWNYFQGPILGYEVSGIEIPALLHQKLTGPSFFTGGNFGFEGSVLSLILCLLAIGGIIWSYEKQFCGSPFHQVKN